MRPSAPRIRASLFGTSLLLASGALAQAPADHSAPPAPGPAAPTAPAKPATPPEAKLQAPASAKPAGTQAMVLGLKTVEGVMGKAVRARAGNEDMGHIVDVLVDDAGQVRAAVIDFGGFLGVGSRKVAVDWKTLDFADSIASGSVKVSLTKDQVRQAPEYKPDEPVVVLEDSTAPKPAAPPPSPPGHKETAPAR